MRRSTWLALCVLPLATAQELSARQWVRHSSVHNAFQGQHLKVGLFAGTFSPYMATNPSAEPMQALSPGQDVVGYIPTFVDAIMTELGATYTWHAVPDTQLPRLFDMLANHTEPDGLDLWVAPRLPQGSYKGRNMFGWQYGTNMAMSHSLYNSHVGALVKKTTSTPSMFRFLEPFETQVSVSNTPTTGLRERSKTLQKTIRLTGKVVLRGMGGIGRGSLRTLASKIIVAHYHSFAVYLQGDDYDWSLGPDRVLRLGLLFFVLIMVSTYTANLAAFFTAPNFTIFGPQNMRELQLATACTTGMGAMYSGRQTPDGQWEVMSPDTDSALAPYVGKLVYPTPDDCPSTGRWTECTIAFCRAQVDSGDADVWLDDASALHQYQMECPTGCDALHMVKDIQFLKSYQDILLGTDPSRQVSLMSFVSEATLYLEMVPTSAAIYNSFFMTDRECPDVEQGSTTRIKLSDMEGLFYFLLASVVLAVALAALNKVTHTARATREHDKGLQHVWRNNESAVPKSRLSDDNIMTVTEVA